jgi:hypothetical protein
MEMFGQTIEIQPGAEEPHYMLHVYSKPGGKVLFGTNPDTAFDPEGVCPVASATASVSASASATARASSGASALADTGGAFPLTPLAPLALLVGAGVLAFRIIRRS